MFRFVHDYGTCKQNAAAQPTSNEFCGQTRFCTTSWSAYFIVTLFLFEKTRQSTRSGGTIETVVEGQGESDHGWLVILSRRGPSRRSEVCNYKWRTLNTRLSSAGTFAVFAGPYITVPKQASIWYVFCTSSTKGLETLNRSSRFEPKICWFLFFFWLFFVKSQHYPLEPWVSDKWVIDWRSLFSFLYTPSLSIPSFPSLPRFS